MCNLLFWRYLMIFMNFENVTIIPKMLSKRPSFWGKGKIYFDVRNMIQYRHAIALFYLRKHL